MVGAVILNYNQWQDAVQCVESLCSIKADLPLRIYLVDNASPQKPNPEELRLFADREVVVLQNAVNRGYAAGNNVGIKRALEDGCDAILISNTDVRYERRSIDVLYEYLVKHPDVGIVGPKIRLQGNRTQKECMAVRTGMKEKYLLRTRLYMFAPNAYQKYWCRDHDYETEIFRVYAVLGCCFMMSRACALDVTPLDENTFLYEEELILGIRMEKAEWKTVYNPDSVICHFHGKSTGDIRKHPFPYICNISSEMYYCKQYLGKKTWQIIPLWFYRTLIYLARCLRYRKFRKCWNDYRKKTLQWL